jgi:hypothetical protein
MSPCRLIGFVWPVRKQYHRAIIPHSVADGRAYIDSHLSPAVAEGPGKIYFFMSHMSSCKLISVRCDMCVQQLWSMLAVSPFVAPSHEFSTILLVNSSNKLLPDSSSTNPPASFLAWLH